MDPHNTPQELTGQNPQNKLKPSRPDLQRSRCPSGLLPTITAQSTATAHEIEQANTPSRAIECV